MGLVAGVVAEWRASGDALVAVLQVRVYRSMTWQRQPQAIRPQVASEA
ncbi:hypothetical protein AWB69_07289 [Caballeronia udeis]|uniref:Uncharacterized protein n=1 Tax=Caballeronia udeis TaxID=1232866 RepID=A0A158J769_9BURK|nr:hypothetical protein AWB69_07289 [Caballeronia udeis]